MNTAALTNSIEATVTGVTKGAKILFANFPGDGHFNPLTGLAAHLKNRGYDVRWYTSPHYQPKIERLSIPFYPFKKALDFTGETVGQVFPDREKCKSGVSKLKFDIINAFILRSEEYYADIRDIYAAFPFDLMISDVAFTGIPFVKDLMKIPVISVGIFPLSESSKDLAPNGLGITPSYTFWGRKKQSVQRFFADKVLFREPKQVMKKMFKKHGIEGGNSNVFDVLVRKSTLVLQSGTPGFEYYRSDLGKNIRFVGPLLPYTSKSKTEKWFDKKLVAYNNVVLVTQGTVEKDVDKIIVPTLEAFKGTDYLVVATTGGTGTQQLREEYPDANFIIEDFIPFSDVMPYSDVYITNGGYGGVMLSIMNKLPMVVAGINEGKNEINARVGYFRLGINLNTELPQPEQIRKAVQEVINNRDYQLNVNNLGDEFREYDPTALCEGYVEQVLSGQESLKIRQRVAQPEYAY